MRLNQQETADSVTFTEEILNGKFYILCKQIKTKQNRNNLKNMKQKQMLKCKLHKQNVCVCRGKGVDGWGCVSVKRYVFSVVDLHEDGFIGEKW